MLGSRIRLLPWLALSASSVACSSGEHSVSQPASGGGGSAAGGTAGVSAGGAANGTGGSAGGSAPSGAWSIGYYASWQADQYPVSEIEWGGLTDIAMSFYMPASDGSLSLLGDNPDVAAALVAAAHAHGVKAIASIGGADSGPAFQQATAASLDALVSNLVLLLDSPGYDGLDFDWEPLETADEPTVTELASRIHTARPSALVTIPVGYVNVNSPPDLSGYVAMAGVFDRINIMTYGMAGAWPGWKSWHSSPIYQSDSATPISIDSSVSAYLAVGVPAVKLGFGIGFYGLCYGPPVTGPDQDLSGSTILASDGDASYANIIGSYYQAGARHWDALARATYLSFANATGPAGCTYLSYDDEQSIAEKGSYLKSKGLGGVIEWEINEGYLSGAAAGQKNPLLAAIRDQVLR